MMLHVLGWLAALADAPTVDAYAECNAALAAGVTEEACRCFYVAARRGGDYERAATLLADVAAARPDDPWPHYVLGDLYSDMGDERAAAFYRAAAEGFAAAGDATEGWVRMSLADVVASGDPEAATAELERASAVAARSGDAVLRATAIAEGARHAVRLDGDYTSVLVALDEAEAHLGDVAAYQTRQVIRQVRASSLQSLGRVREALATRLAMVDAAAAAGDVFVETGSLATAAELAARHPDTRDDAIAWAERALVLATEHDNALAAAYVHCLLGDLDRDVPRDHYQRCLEGAADDPQIAAGAEIGLAWRVVDEDPEAALAGVARAVAILRTSGSAVELAVGRVAVAWRAAGPMTARAMSDAVLDELDAVIASQRHAVGRAGLLGDFSAVYRHVAHELAMASDDATVEQRVDESLAVIERWRGRVLTEQLDGDGVLRLDARDAAVEAHRAALGAYERAHAKVLASTVPDASMLGALGDAEREVTRTWDAVLAGRPGAPLLRPRAPTLAEIRAALADDEALLSFHGADALDVPGLHDIEVPTWAWIITHDHAIAVDLDVGRELPDLVALYVGAIERGDGSDGGPAVALYGRLLAEPMRHVPSTVSSLVVVADGDLAALPFATLRPHAEAAPLAERYATSLAGSVASWLRLRARSADATDPSISALVIAAPDPPPVGVTPLPWALGEAERVRERLAGRGARVTLATGTHATSSAVRQGARSARIVHFATHAVTDLAHAGRQALALARSDDDDGWLRPHDISSLELDGALVVLASCRSASGATTASEGPMGLGRAFLVAGARAVVATHWPVRDDDAAAFSDRFYDALQRGQTVAGAVASAQRDLRRRGAPAAVWAAFTVLGDGGWAPLVVTDRQLGWLAALALVAVAVGGVFAVIVRRR